MGDRIEASWLSIRREADTAAREASLPLVEVLAEHCASLGHGSDELNLVDIGAGTGANAEWLAPRLREAFTHAGALGPLQHWHLLDHDKDLLDARRLLLPDERDRVSDHVGTTRDIAALLARIRRPVLLTCSALLDLLTPTEIRRLAQDAARGADGALFALSVTGAITLTPGDRDDVFVSELFNAHQQQTQAHDGAAPEAAAGPAGWQHACSAFEAVGWTVHLAQTPWRLVSPQDPIARRLLTERAEAATQMADSRASRDRVSSWWDRRERRLSSEGLAVWVDHRDLLALPPNSISVQMSSPRQ